MAECSKRGLGIWQNVAERGAGITNRQERKKEEMTVSDMCCFFPLSVLSKTILRWKVLCQSCKDFLYKSL